jgi:hypothetical protein
MMYRRDLKVHSAYFVHAHPNDERDFQRFDFGFIERPPLEIKTKPHLLDSIKDCLLS